VSAVALPGNDFWLFDNETVVFLIFAGSGLVIDACSLTISVTSEPQPINLPLGDRRALSSHTRLGA
jgi:hypothetical protein